MADTQTIVPSLWLAPDQVREAAELYVSLFPDAAIESDIHLENPAGPEFNADLVHVRIGTTIIQMMGAERADLSYTDALSLSVTVPDQAALDEVWDGFLAKGGEEMACSWIIDPYGVRWQVLPQAYHDLTEGVDSEQRQRVVEALWQMTRVDVAGLEAAARG